MARWRIDFLSSVGPEETSSGLGRVVWDLAGSLARLGHTVRVLYPADPPTPHAPVDGVEAVPIPALGGGRRPFGRDIAFGKRATGVLDPRADVVVGNDEKAGAVGALGGRAGPAWIHFAHDVALHTFDTLRPLEPDRGFRQRFGNWLDRRSLKGLEDRAISRSRLVLVGSATNADLLRRYYKVPPDRVQLLPIGVPRPLDVGSREAARLALHVPPDVPVVAFVGRNPERQGLPIALEAFRRVRSFFPGARMLVVGSKPATEPGVLPLGVVDEETKARALRAADLFLFPARYEGFGLAPREAMGYGLATVVSAHVPLDGVDRSLLRVVASEDPGDYASELAELLADVAMRRALGDAARAASAAWSFDAMAERFERAVAPFVRPRAR